MAAETTAPKSSTRVADAARDNLVDRWAPAALLPYMRLARFDRPIGAWLLLYPCWWGLALAELARGSAYPNPLYVVLFLVGAFVMRGAGCTYNDIIDRDFDARVARTASRPIPSGQVTVPQALAFAISLSLVGLAVLVQFNAFTIALGASSLILVAIYPFAKRFTNWPQLVLGLTFKWGALVGWSAVTGSLALPALLLYVGCVMWTIGYDTIYAHQDTKHDGIIGVKSTALTFGTATTTWVGGLYAGASALWLAAGLLAGARLLFIVALAMAAGHFTWQVTTLRTDDPANCLQRFKSNQVVGWLLFLGLGADMALAWALRTF